jgi:ElaB/YqjD/DUF883 family membrane-anchored ribosome-binding protein
METEKGASRDMADKPHEAMPTTPQGAALGETVKAGLDRAGARVKDAADKARDTLGGYREGGVEQVLQDIAEYVRSQPITALLAATGVGILIGIVLAAGRKAEG